MSVYIAPFTFDFGTSRIRVDLTASEVSVIDLYAAIREARATEEGILYDAIGIGSGLVELGAGTKVGLTVALLGSWQIKFEEGAYIARIAEGNLVGGPGGDPVAYSAGVQILLIWSAASTVVEVAGEGGGSGPTASEVAAAVWARPSRTLTADPGQAEHDATQAAIAALGLSLGSIPEDVLGEEIEPGYSVARALRIIAAAVAGKTAGGPDGFTARNLGDTADQITGAADESGNRTSATYGA